MLIRAGSVSQTIEAVQAALLEQCPIAPNERANVAKWLAARQGLPGAYADTFAGFDAERSRGIVVFTGERITSASARHILGEEACRALRLLDVRDRAVRAALDRANEGLMGCLERAARDPRNTNPGKYCCFKCSVGMWRHLLAGGLDRAEERLERGVALLRPLRDGEGRWRGFPFWYTSLALSEMKFHLASAELDYARGVLERAARGSGSTLYARRRRALAERVLAAA